MVFVSGHDTPLLNKNLILPWQFHLGIIIDSLTVRELSPFWLSQCTLMGPDTYYHCVLWQPRLLKPGQHTDEFNHLELEVVGACGHRDTLRPLKISFIIHPECYSKCILRFSNQLFRLLFFWQWTNEISKIISFENDLS